MIQMILISFCCSFVQFFPMKKDKNTHITERQKLLKTKNTFSEENVDSQVLLEQCILPETGAVPNDYLFWFIIIVLKAVLQYSWINNFKSFSSIKE